MKIRRRKIKNLKQINKVTSILITTTNLKNAKRNIILKIRSHAKSI